jgi:hypothetical protein
MQRQQADALLTRELEDDLVRRFGTLLSSAVLIPTLGYPSAQAYQQAMTRGQLPVPVFAIAKRRGRFALAKDVARWLAVQRAGAEWPNLPAQDARSTQPGPTLSQPAPRKENAM